MGSEFLTLNISHTALQQNNILILIEKNPENKFIEMFNDLIDNYSSLKSFMGTYVIVIDLVFIIVIKKDQCF